MNSPALWWNQNFIGQNIGQAGQDLLVGACHAAGTAGRKVFKVRNSLPDTR